MELKVTGLDARQVLDGAARHLKAQAVGHEAVLLLQRITWRHHQPYLINEAALKNALRYCHVALVDGIE